MQVSIAELYQNNEDGSRTTALQGPLDARMVRLHCIYALLWSADHICTYRVPTRKERSVRLVAKTLRNV